MLELLYVVARWTIRNFFSFVVIVAVLLAAKIIQKEFLEFESVTGELAVLRNEKADLETYRDSIQNEVLARINSSATASLDKLDARVAAIEREIQKIEGARRDSGFGSTMLANLPLGRNFVDQLKRDMDVRVLEAERDYLKHLGLIGRARLDRNSALAEKERLRKIHVATYADLQKTEAELSIAQDGSFWATRVFIWSPEYKRYQDLKNAYEVQYAINARASEAYARQSKLVESITVPSFSQFNIPREKIDQALKPLQDLIADREKRERNNWVKRASGPVIDVIPTAAVILLSIILLPIAIKAFFYFIVAPWAARSPPLRLLPSASGRIEALPVGDGAGNNRGKMSAVSMPVVLGADQELLIQPEYLQSTSLQSQKGTKWLLNPSIPFASLLSGMFMLTRVSPAGSEPIVISATKDPLSEVGIVTLAEGAAFVCQPRCLAGVVQNSRNPIRITRHWRLANLQSWLTLQLRFLVFHGPGQLILKGCRGIRIENSGAGRLINQAATLGFSANLAYANTRCETFVSYWRGEEDLFNDLFTGESGVYVYEETPDLKRTTGIGRHLEGFTDAVLKAFGV